MTRAVALAGALAVSFGAAACSKSDSPTTGAGTAAASSTTAAPATTQAAPKPAEVLEKAKANALSATSAAFTGSVTQESQKIDIDYKGTGDGKTSDITISMGSQGKARLITVPAGVFIQADQAFWKAQGAPASVQKAGDKFIQAPASASSMTDSLSLKSFLTKAFQEVTPDKLASDVGEESVNGVDCWVLNDKKGKSEGSLYVSKDASQIVRFTGSTKSPGQLDFSRWNEDLGIAAPPKSQVMSIG